MALLGIDLGTTFSAVSRLDANGTPVTIPNAEGELTTPSVVLFDGGGDVIVGREARRAALAEPERVAECVKRFMGDPYYPRLINGKRLSPTAISALVLKKLKQDAERSIGTIDGVVITVPAYFDEARRQATADAGKLAGLKVIDILNEPTAAALAYAFRTLAKDATTPEQIDAALAGAPSRIALVYDLGGGTFDVTVLRIEGRQLTVLATAGDVRLGGRDWDERLFRHMADQFVKAHGADPRDDPISYQNLMLAAEETKKVLSLRKQAGYVVNHAGKALRGEVTRQQFQEMTEDLLYRTESRLGRVIRQAGLNWEQVTEVLAVGGSTRMPQVVEMLRRVTGREANNSLSPDEAVAHGAAIHAAIRAANVGQRHAAELPPLDVELLPEKALHTFKPGVVNLLRAVRTADVNSHSLGVVATAADGAKRVAVLIPHNTRLPASVRKRFGTASEGQQSVTVRVVEGESQMPEECIQIGSCSVRPLPRGLPKGSPIEVTFSYDASGRLHVQATEATSGTAASVSIERRAALERGAKDAMADTEIAGKTVT